MANFVISEGQKLHSNQGDKTHYWGITTVGHNPRLEGHWYIQISNLDHHKILT